MSTTADTQMAYAPALERPRLAQLQYLLLWAIGAASAIVLIEPSPYEVMTLIGVVVFMATGLKLRISFLPLIVLLFLCNLGYSICSVHLLDQPRISLWVVTSWYMAVTTVFFAMVLAEDTEQRLDILRRGIVVGAVIASVSGIAAYFKLVPGGYDILTLYGRARGTFKDPNALGAFLVLPMLFVLQRIITATVGKALLQSLVLGILGLALLLSFSRAAWGMFAGSAVFMIAMMFLTSRSINQRARIVTMSVVAIALLAAAVAVLLSMETVSELFKERASFKQGYDVGRFGRFGRHLLGADMALDLPWGIGPLQFSKYFPEDTHNSYLNAFMSGGWIGGICFLALVFSTVAMGFKYLLKPVPWQPVYIAIFAGFLASVAEAFVVDVDHWRHFWMMLGAMWGMFAAAEMYIRSAHASDRQEIFSSS